MPLTALTTLLVTNAASLACNIGFNAIKDGFTNQHDAQKIKAALVEFIDAKLANRLKTDGTDEVDWKGLVKYIETSLQKELKLYLFSVANHEDIKAEIINKVAAYTKNKNENEPLITELINELLRLLRAFYVDKLDKNDILLHNITRESLLAGLDATEKRIVDNANSNKEEIKVAISEAKTAIKIEDFAYFKDLQDDIDLLQDTILNTNDELKKLRLSERLNKKEAEFQQKKKEVQSLYELLHQIPINSERLKLAKEYFDKCEFSKANAILKEAEILKEAKTLKQAINKKTAELAELESSLKEKASEFLVKAKLCSILHETENWFEEAKRHYQQSIEIFKDVEAIFAYALFLHKHNQFSEAEKKYHETLEIRRTLAKENPKSYNPELAHSLNNLALLQSDTNNFSEAEKNYKEALKIYRNLAKENPQSYNPDLASSLNNLGALQRDTNNFSKAEKNYHEALEIRSTLAKENPKSYNPDLAMSLNNLALLQSETNQFSEAEKNFHQALDLYRTLAKENSKSYNNYLAISLNNLAILQSNTNQFSEAEKNYEEALEIKRTLAKENPKSYNPDVAMSLNNLALYYTTDVPNKLKSIAYASEAINILTPMANKTPEMLSLIKLGEQIIEYWESN